MPRHLTEDDRDDLERGIIPPGGTSGEALLKQSGADWDVGWGESGGNGGGNGGGGGGGLLTRVFVDAAQPIIDLEWSQDVANLKVVVLARSTSSVAVSADHLYLQLGDGSALDDGSSSYEHAIIDRVGNTESSSSSYRMWLSRLGVTTNSSSIPRHSRIEFDLYGTDQTEDPVDMRIITSRAYNSRDRDAFGWGSWLNPTGSARRLRLFMQAGDFREWSQAYVIEM